MTSRSIHLFLAALLSGLVLLSPAAQAKGGGLNVVASGMGFFNSTVQGGAGPQGSTVLTQLDLVKDFEWFGLGAFGQLDFQGANETDTGFGPKLEIQHGHFYVEGGWIASLRRAFTDRSISSQTGYGWLLGAGVRFNVGTGRMFLQFSYKYRIHIVKEQDGTPLSQPITQKDGYPLFGVGLQF